MTCSEVRYCMALAPRQTVHKVPAQHPTFMSMPVSCPVFPREDSGSGHGSRNKWDSSEPAPLLFHYWVTPLSPDKPPENHPIPVYNL
jgi:hypothetical protein